MREGSTRTLAVWLAVAALLGTCVPGGPAAAVEPVPPLPLSVAILTDGSAGPVVDAAWLASQVEMVGRTYAPHGLSFVLVESRSLAVAPVVRTLRDRDALAAHVRRGVANAFVVAFLGDGADPDQGIGGRHWRARGRQYVIVARDCWRDTLAHELGHYLGHRGHSDVPGNLMSYLRLLPVSTLSDAQAAAMRRTARRYLRSGEVHAVGPRAQR